jgi:hypothetical protein
MRWFRGFPEVHKNWDSEGNELTGENRRITDSRGLQPPSHRRGTNRYDLSAPKENPHAYLPGRNGGSNGAHNIYELENYCLTSRYKECPIIRKYHQEEKLMHNSGAERRKHKRFKVALPVNIRLIDPKTGKLKQAQFKGLITDISMGGLGLEMKYPGSDLLSFAPKLVGENKEFDLNVDVKLETGDVKGVAEVRWARIPPLTGLEILTMGLLLKRMRDNEKRKWRDFVLNRSKGTP